MSSSNPNGEPNASTLGNAVREPQQIRSRAGYERVLAAAAELLQECGPGGFTLRDVSKKAKVSIGSIYYRFETKDDLVQAVQGRYLTKLINLQRGVIASALAQSTDVRTLVPTLIDLTAEMFHREAAMMRSLMMHAVTDKVISTGGRDAYDDFLTRMQAAILTFRGEIRHPDPERAVNSIVRIAYSAIARALGFGSQQTLADLGDWSLLKEDLSRMSVLLLLDSSSPRT